MRREQRQEHSTHRVRHNDGSLGRISQRLRNDLCVPGSARFRFVGRSVHTNRPVPPPL